MTKQQVRNKMLSAKSLPDCAAAWDAHRVHLTAHPEDEQFLLDASESLYMTEQGLKSAARVAKPTAASRAS